MILPTGCFPLILPILYLIYYDGETYAMDSGICHYSSPFAKVLQREDRHNVMAPLDGSGGILSQNRVGTVPKFSAAGDARTFHAEADLTNCWQGKFKVRTRKLDSNQPGALTLTDCYETVNGQGVAFFWLAPFPIKVEGRTVTISGEKGHRLTFAAPEPWTLKTERLTRENAPDQYRLTMANPAPAGELKLEIKLIP